MTKGSGDWLWELKPEFDDQYEFHNPFYTVIGPLIFLSFCFFWFGQD
jgi:hypothetical protein